YDLLLALMTKRGKLNTPCHICISPKEFKEKFLKFLASEDGKSSFIIRNADEKDRMDATIHYFPIYAEKTSNSMFITLTDSLGIEGFAHQYLFLLKET